MRYLFKQYDKLKQVLSNKSIFLFLDYDGTLTPIVESPARAIISKECKDLLKKLTEISHCKLAIISGRALADIKHKVGIRGIIYVGNHGLEIEGPKIKFKNPITPKYRLILGKIKKELNYRLSSIKGAIIEDKGLSLSLHFRLVNKGHILSLKTIFHEVVGDYLSGGKVRIKPGKMVLEIRPPIKWDKGKVVLWLLARQRFLKANKVFPIYIGDDITDEDAFKALRNIGLTIFVGPPKPSNAKYYLRNTNEVMQFLKQICHN